MNDLYLVAINLTRRCNLACAHCYMDAKTREQDNQGELGTAQVKELLTQIGARSSETMVVLTGGEPLLRQDLETLTAHGSRLGLSMVIGTNGVLLDRARVCSLKNAGAIGIGISLDSLDPARHDAFRGIDGSWEQTLNAMEACRREGLPFQVHFSVTERNAHETAAIIEFSKAVGAHVLNFFFLVCTGRGESMSDITPARYEQVLHQLAQAQRQSGGLIIRARCAPHFKRIVHQIDPESPLTRAQGYEGGGCLAGIHYCRITPEGGVTACPYIPVEEGNIRNTPFWEIWDRAPGFRQLRQPELTGACGRCEYRVLCGGCRARPLAMGKTLMDDDPWCDYTPQGGMVIPPLDEGHSAMTWTSEAQQRLSRVPAFLRKMVRKRVESHVQGLGETQITPEHLASLAPRRFTSAPTERPEAPSRTLPWTREAMAHLQALPAFLHSGIVRTAEEVARAEGRLEVNVKLLQRLEEEAESHRQRRWEPEAEQALTRLLENHSPRVRPFLQPAMEAAAERETARRNAETVTAADMQKVIETESAGVEWAPEALARVRSAPDFIRAGIKKAAEFSARRENKTLITSADLTRYRNRAMMRAVRRLRSFGAQELDFNTYEIARTRVPRLQENPRADKRFAAIREYVEARKTNGSRIGLLDQALMEKMKRELKR